MESFALIEQFADAIRSAGLVPPDEILADGKIHRFAPSGRGKPSAWYVLHAGGVPAGAFGDWCLGWKSKWRAHAGHMPVEQVKATYHARATEAADRHATAAVRARAIWDRALPASGEHPYLLRKGVGPHGTRVADCWRLVVPVLCDGEVVSLQFIAGDGTKRFLAGGRVSGGHYIIGEPRGSILIAEGFATAATLHECCGKAAVVGFNAGNLPAAARAVRAAYPDADLVVCGDDDVSVAGNPGLTKATEAARVAGARLAVPGFGSVRVAGESDFNDLARRLGRERVTQAVASAKAPGSG